MSIIKKIMGISAAVFLAASAAGCGASDAGTATADVETVETQTEISTADSETSNADLEDTNAESTGEETQTTASDSEGTGAADETTSTDGEASSTDAQAEETLESAADDVTVRIAALKGPTTIGLVNLIDDAANGNADGSYDFTMYTAGSDVMAAMVSGDIDIGLIPANVAAVMNSKVDGGVSVIDINTLGVLYCITGDESISSVADLAGKTVYTTGQGSTPEYTIRYLLDKNSVTDCNLEFKSEATEVAALLADDPSGIAILPQPFVTAACIQNESLKPVFSLDDEWAKVNSDCRIVTGVTVVSNKFLSENKETVDAFISAHEESAKAVISDPEKTAALVVEQGIIAKEPIARKAIPNCNITCITGEEIEKALAGYYQVLFDQDPKSVGGALPDSSFYYTGK